MNFQQIELKVQEHIDLIIVSPKGLNEAPDRATKFLIMQAILVDCLKSIEEDLAKLVTLRDATYSEAFRDLTGEKVTEKKIMAEANIDYSGSREGVEIAEARRSWVKAYIKIFENAHLTWRNFSKEQ